MDLSKFVAIIPARGGSKGIDKNIVDINGKPLISFTIEAAQALFNKEQIFVSTDSAEIEIFLQNLGQMFLFETSRNFARLIFFN